MTPLDRRHFVYHCHGIQLLSSALIIPELLGPKELLKPFLCEVVRISRDLTWETHCGPIPIFILQLRYSPLPLGCVSQECIIPLKDAFWDRANASRVSLPGHSFQTIELKVGRKGLFVTWQIQVKGACDLRRLKPDSPSASMGHVCTET